MPTAAVPASAVTPAAPAKPAIPEVTTGDPPAIVVERGKSGEAPTGLKASPIQLRSGEKAIWSPYPGTFLAIVKDGDGAEVWDAAAGKKAGRRLTGLPRAQRYALSPDGRHLALLVIDGQQSRIALWSIESGKPGKTFTYAGKAGYSDQILFAGPDRLLIAQPGSQSTPIHIWDIRDGKQIGELSAPPYVPERAPVVSDDGELLAVFGSIGEQSVIVFDVARGERIAELPLASRCQALAFSPDGQELAALLSDGITNRLVSWVPEKRQQVTSFLTTASSSGLPGAISYQGPLLEWLPDRSGWLLWGHAVVDRASEQVVWTFQSAEDDLMPAARRPLDSDRLALFAGPPSLQRMQVAHLPWTKINASLQALGADAPAALKPGQGMTLELEIGKLRGGTIDETRDVLAEAVARALAERNIELADDQPVVLALRYEEREGEELEELASERGPGGIPLSPFSPNAKGTGRTLKATHIVCQLDLKLHGNSLWSSKIEIDPRSILIRGKDFTDAAARESALQMVAIRLAYQPLPYFVSEDPTLTLLPGTTKLKGGGAGVGVKVKTSKR
jgi:hypothetical protein